MESGKAGTPRHPIGVVAERTGLSLDTLRVWERRYGVVVPARSATSRRLYSDEDVTRLRLLQAAMRSGRSIGQVAHLATAELEALVEEDDAARSDAHRDQAPAPAQSYVEDAMARTLALDGDGLEAVLRRASAGLGLWDFASGVVAPLLRRVGDAWHTGQVTAAQEHLASAAMRRVLLASTDLLPAQPTAANLVVATLPGERHEMGALLAAAAAMIGGWRVTYLGPDLPAGEIAGAAIETRASAVALSLSYVADYEGSLQELRTLRGQLPTGVELLVGGAGAAMLAPGINGTGIRLLRDLAELRAALETLAS